MKNKFSEYYYLSEEQQRAIIENNGDDTLYVFDTNVFLSIYEASKETAETTLEILEFVANHSWMPYQVGLEFHRNRIDKFKKRRLIISDSKKGLVTNTDEIRKIFKNEVLFDDQLDSNIKDLVDALCKKGEALLKDQLSEAEARERNDEYLARIENIYSDEKIGNPLNRQQYEVLQKTMDKQWEKKKGLGNKDFGTKKDQFEIYPGNFMFCNAYGDPVIIEEIKNEVARRNLTEATLKNVVFVSNDQKSDFITELANGQKAPQQYLQRYMCEVGENYTVPLKQFIQVTLTEFIKHMKGKIDRLSETQIADAANEIEDLVVKNAATTNFESDEFKEKIKHIGKAAAKYINEMRMNNAQEEVCKFVRMKEIHKLNDLSKPFQQVIQEYTNANRHWDWEEVSQSLQTYERWLDKYSYNEIETRIDEALSKAQQEYFDTIVF